jgi:hypothetical protein
MRSLICAAVLSAICVCPLVGCDSAGGPEEGVPNDAIGKAPPPMPGMDLMKGKMEKKKK